MARLTVSTGSHTLTPVAESACVLPWLPVALVVAGCGGAQPSDKAAVVAVDIPPVPETSTVEDADEDRAAEVTERVRTPGTWQGRGVQDDGQSWDIVVEVRGHDQRPCALVQYPPHGGSIISCGGEWHCDWPPSTPDRLVATERILEGVGRCIDGCQVDADLVAGIFRFDCPHAGVTGKAELSRVH